MRLVMSDQSALRVWSAQQDWRLLCLVLLVLLAPTGIRVIPAQRGRRQQFLGQRGLRGIRATQVT